MTELTTLIVRVSNAKTTQDVWDMFEPAMATYGFDRLIYGFTPYRSGNALGDPKDWHILANQTDEYMRDFVEGGLYLHAPMVQWALTNDGACSWGHVDSLRRSAGLSRESENVVNYNKSHGVLAGYTLSFRSVSRRGKGALALTARADLTQDQVDEIWAKHGDEITAIANVVHLKLMTLPFAGARTLTQRQLEVLEWVSEGKLTQDVATILGVSVATIEKHLRLARIALDVDTTTQAVLKAASFNQMFLSQPED